MTGLFQLHRDYSPLVEDPSTLRVTVLTVQNENHCIVRSDASENAVFLGVRCKFTMDSPQVESNHDAAENDRSSGPCTGVRFWCLIDVSESS